MSTCPAGHELAWWVDKKGWVVGYDPSKVAAGSDVSSGGQSNDASHSTLNQWRIAVSRRGGKLGFTSGAETEPRSTFSLC